MRPDEEGSTSFLSSTVRYVVCGGEGVVVPASAAFSAAADIFDAIK